MSDIAVKIENLGKRYQLGHTVDLKRTFRETLSELPGRLTRRRPKPSVPVYQEIDPETPAGHFWALRDINIEVKAGEVLGIIGRNGAGKSTLLKILSRITDPTTGRALVHGRMASLLEVGTGFHPELTGRENIYLNGTILGMKRGEIDRKFDEIVAFAEVEKFLDTPVKRYSSGMYVRLAFAVAAHLEPEIMVVDEVLAVGDAAFQKRCLGRMGSVAKEGRTVLFVSHNMAAVESLCTRAVLLQNGIATKEGSTQEVIGAYLSGIKELTADGLEKRTDRSGNGRLRFTALRMEDPRGKPIDVLSTGSDARIVLNYEADGPVSNVSVSIGFYGTMGQFLVLCGNEMVGQPFEQLDARGEIHCVIPKFPMTSGNYNLNLYCEVNGTLADWVQEATQLTVVEGDYFGSGRHPRITGGSVLVQHSWSHT